MVNVIVTESSHVGCPNITNSYPKVLDSFNKPVIVNKLKFRATVESLRYRTKTRSGM